MQKFEMSGKTWSEDQPSLGKKYGKESFLSGIILQYPELKAKFSSCESLEEMEELFYQLYQIRIEEGLVASSIPLIDYLELRSLSLFNTAAEFLGLGKFIGPQDPNCYVRLAKNKGDMYFCFPDYWPKVQKYYGLTYLKMFDLFLKAAMDDAVITGKQIRFYQNPLLPEYAFDAIKREWDYLAEHYAFHLEEAEDGNWYAKR